MGTRPTLCGKEGDGMSIERHRRYRNKSGRESQDTFADFVKLVLFMLGLETLFFFMIFSK